MRRHRFQWLAAIPLVCVGVAILMAAQKPDRSRPSEQDVDSYIKLHQDILDCLRESFQQPHPFVDADSFRPQTANFAWPVSSKNHERDVLLTGQWDGQQIKKYLIVLNLKQGALPATSGNANTMESTVMLKHYFRPLERLGLTNPSSPLTAVSAIQYSAGEWVPKDRCTSPQSTDSPAWVEGEVFLSRRDGQVVIRVSVGGRFTPKGN